MNRFVIAGIILLTTIPAFSQEPADSVFAPPPPYLFRDGQKVKVWKAEIKGDERTRSDADFLRFGRRDMSDTTYSIARIPISNSVSPYGGMIYSMPVATASGFNLVPSISLAYNSQGGNGVAGYGWDISGVSSIRLTNKNLYYHGSVQPAGRSGENSAYSLDGDPLVQNDDAATSASWPLVTAHGKVLVQLNKVPITNEVKSFTLDKWSNG